MAGNVVKRRSIRFGLKKTFHSTGIFCTPSGLLLFFFLLLTVLCLPCADLAIHSYAVHSVLKS